MSKTVFAKIIDREIPAKIVHEDDRCLAFHDVNPIAPTHILVVPKKPIDQLENITADDEALIGHLFFAAAEIARKQGLKNGYRIVVNNGSGAGQTVFHLHLHLLAGRPFSWPPG
jgi:histidine triad (HIT) family protein